MSTFDLRPRSKPETSISRQAAGKPQAAQAAAGRAVDARTAKLRDLRLAKEAAEADKKPGKSRPKA